MVRYKNARASVADTLRVRGSAPKESQRSRGCRRNLRVVTADDQWHAQKTNQGFCRLKTRDEVSRPETTFGVPDPFKAPQGQVRHPRATLDTLVGLVGPLATRHWWRWEAWRARSGGSPVSRTCNLVLSQRPRERVHWKSLTDDDLPGTQWKTPAKRRMADDTSSGGLLAFHQSIPIQ